jgi:hypothetical protein
VAAADGRPRQQAESGRRCIFTEVLGCSGRHPPWKCRRFRNGRPKEREKITEDNRLCAFCLLHDKARPCGAKEKQDSTACNAPGCKGRHIRKLHEFLKDIYGEESRVHLVQEDGGWEEPEGARKVDETEEEEAMIVNTIQQVESSWQETGNSWLELGEEEDGEIYCVGTCHGEGEAVETGWWSPVPRELQFSKGEEKHLIDLLLGGSATDKSTSGAPRVPEAASAASRPSGEGETVKKEARTQGEDQKNGSATGRGSKKAAAEKKGGK